MRTLSCGLDFGTSNSTFGIVDEHGAPHLLALEDGKPTIPSVLFYNFEDDKTYYGRAAIAEYVANAEGRVLRALKSMLGSALMNEETRIKARRIPFTEILGTFLEELRQRAESQAGCPLENVVAGRPVQFVDGDNAADKVAQDQLEASIRDQGFRNIEFQYEPIAAALDYERKINNEELALVVDIGGGTSDFTIVRLSPDRAKSTSRQNDILATAGVHIGGTDFDKLLSMKKIMPNLGLGSAVKSGNRVLPVGPYFDLSTWHRINRLYTRKAMVELQSTRQEAVEKAMVDNLIAIIGERYGHLLASHVEDAKIALTDAEAIEFKFERPEVELNESISRADLYGAIAEEAGRIPKTILGALADAGVTASQIQTLIMTGGSTQIPAVRDGFDGMFENATYVETDAFGSVGLGLSLDASRRFGH